MPLGILRVEVADVFAESTPLPLFFCEAIIQRIDTFAYYIRACGVELFFAVFDFFDCFFIHSEFKLSIQRLFWFGPRFFSCLYNPHLPTWGHGLIIHHVPTRCQEFLQNTLKNDSQHDTIFHVVCPWVFCMWEVVHYVCQRRTASFIFY